ncbi:MAG: oligosaccharide flippase family protein [Chloroflexia bacterium]
MLRRLVHVSKDALVYGIAGALSRFSGLILLPLFTGYFTTDQYGIYQSVTNLGALLVAITVLGLDGATAILYFSSEDVAFRKSITTLWVLITAAFSIPVTLLLFAGADWLSLLATGSADYGSLFRLGIALLPFSVFLVTASGILRYTFKAGTYAALNFGLTVVVVGAIVYFVSVAHMGLEGALWGTLIGNALLALVAVWAVRDAISLGGNFAELRPRALRMLQLGLPLVPASIALWITNFSNTYFLVHLAGAGSAGVFRIGAQLAALLSLVIWAFQLAWGPYSLSIAKADDAPRTFSRIATLFTAGTVGVSVLLSALAPVVLKIFTTKAYAEAGSVIGLLSLAAAASGAYQVVAIGTTLAQRTGPVAWTAISAAVANVILNLALIPVLGIVGAGVASLAANLVSTVLVYVIAQRLYPLPYEPIKIVVIWLAGSVCVAVSGAVNAGVDPSVWLSFAVAILLLAIFAVVLIVFRIVTPRDFSVISGAAKRVMERRRSG